MPKTLRQKLLLALIALLLIVAGYYWNVGLELFNEQPTVPARTIPSTTMPRMPIASSTRRTAASTTR